MLKKNLSSVLCATILALMIGAAPPIYQGKEASLQIKELTRVYALTVPVSQLIMTIPKGNLSRDEKPSEGGNNSPGYFYLSDNAFGLVISGWFESEKTFPGITKLWEENTKKWRTMRLPDPQDVVFGKVGDWDSISYELPRSTGSNPHVRAQWLQSGTWIDLHLSLLSNRPIDEARAQLLELLKAIRVREKVTKDDGALISRVRGAVRYQMQQGKGCLPWASVVRMVGSEPSFTDFSLPPEKLKEFGNDPLTDLTSLVNYAITHAQNPALVAGAIAGCEKTQSQQEGPMPYSSIVVFLEHGDELAIKLNFPFQQAADGQISYIESKLTVEVTQSRLFRESGRD